MLRWPIVLLSIFSLGVAPDAAAPASPAPVRFGFIEPVSNNPLSQVGLDRYARYFVDRFAEVESVTTIPIPEAGGTNRAGAEVCRELQLSGFLRPTRHWQITDTTVRVDAQLIVTDCNGDMFFAGGTTLIHERSTTMLPQDQIDGVSQKAAAVDLAKFLAFTEAHRATWNRLVTTGSMRESAASPTPSSER